MTARASLFRFPQHRREARFWCFLNGSPVLLKVPHGETFRWGTWERTEEGWSSEEHAWTYRDGLVTWCDESDGTDCDGRMSRSHVSNCEFHQLRAHRPASVIEETGGQGWPAWAGVDSSQRDYSAERAGY